MSATRPWASTWPRSMIATEVHSSSSSGRMCDETRIVLPSAPQLAQELAQLDPGPRVEARGRLVEEQHLRVVDQRVGEAQPLLHAAREALDVGVALGPEVHEVEQVADHPPPAVGRDAVAAGEEVQVLPDLHVVVDPEAVRHEPEDAADVVGVPADRRAGDLGVAARRGRAASRGSAASSSCRRRWARRGRRSRPRATSRSRPADGERPVVALDEAGGRDDAAHSTVPVMRDRELEVDPVLALVDEPDLDLAARRVDPAGRRPRARTRRPCGHVRELDPLAGPHVEHLDLRQAVLRRTRSRRPPGRSAPAPGERPGLPPGDRRCRRRSDIATTTFSGVERARRTAAGGRPSRASPVPKLMRPRVLG